MMNVICLRQHFKCWVGAAALPTLPNQRNEFTDSHHLCGNLTKLESRAPETGAFLFSLL